MSVQLQLSFVALAPLLARADPNVPCGSSGGTIQGQVGGGGDPLAEGHWDLITKCLNKSWCGIVKGVKGAEVVWVLSSEEVAIHWQHLVIVGPVLIVTAYESPEEDVCAHTSQPMRGRLQYWGP